MPYKNTHKTKSMMTLAVMAFSTAGKAIKKANNHYSTRRALRRADKLIAKHKR